MNIFRLPSLLALPVLSLTVGACLSNSGPDPTFPQHSFGGTALMVLHIEGLHCMTTTTRTWNTPDADRFADPETSSETVPRAPCPFEFISITPSKFWERDTFGDSVITAFHEGWQEPFNHREEKITFIIDTVRQVISSLDIMSVDRFLPHGWEQNEQEKEHFYRETRWIRLNDIPYTVTEEGAMLVDISGNEAAKHINSERCGSMRQYHYPDGSTLEEITRPDRNRTSPRILLELR